MGGYFEYSHTLNKNTYSFGIFDKSIVFIKTSDGFIRTFQALKKGSLSMPQQNKKYNIKTDGSFLRYQGIFYQKNIYFKKTKFLFRINSIFIKEYIDVDKDGYIIDYGKSQKFDLNIKHHYSYKNIFTNNKRVFWTRFSPRYFQYDDIQSNIGYSTDIGVEKNFFNTKASFFVNNAISDTSIKYLMYYQANATSKTKYLGDDGYYHLRPIVLSNYKELKSNYHITLPKIYTFKIDHKNFDYKIIGFKDLYYDFFTLYYANLALSYSFLQKYYYLGIRKNNLKLLISTTFDDDSKKSTGIQLEYNVKF